MSVCFGLLRIVIRV